MHAKKRVKLSSPSSLTWRLSPVLSTQVTGPQPLIAVYTARIVDRRHTSRLIRQLNIASPMKSLTHVKRCHDSRIILAVADLTPEMCVRTLVEAGVDLTGLELDTLPGPCGQVPSGHLEHLPAPSGNQAGPPGEVPTDLDDKSLPVRCFSDSPELSKHLKQLPAPSGNQPVPPKPSESLEHLPEPSRNQAVPPEPSESLVQLPGPSRNQAEPPKPSPKLPQRQLVAAVKPRTRAQYDEVATLWPTNYHEDKPLELMLSGDFFSSQQLLEMERVMQLCLDAGADTGGCSGAAVVDGAGTVLAVVGDDRRRHPLQHAVMLAVDVVARLQGGGAWTTHKKRDKEVEKKTGPYLCTGYDVFVTREPCLMCAMALVHSRARRVLYGCESGGGGLKTLAKLHTVAGLNHSYLVFGGVMEAECRRLSDS